MSETETLRKWLIEERAGVDALADLFQTRAAVVRSCLGLLSPEIASSAEATATAFARASEELKAFRNEQVLPCRAAEEKRDQLKSDAEERGFFKPHTISDDGK